MKKVIYFLGMLFIFFQACSPKDEGVKEGGAKEKVLREKVVVDGGSHEEVIKPQCVTARDCRKTEDCRKGKCVKAEPCSGLDECSGKYRCFERTRCIERCDYDTMCPAKGYVCVDGICHKPHWKKGKLPNEGKTQKTKLRVGVGVAELDHPLGVSMAGFGMRPGPKGPYAKSLGSSEGMYDRFNVKAIVLDNGIERLVIVRSPLVFTTDFLVTQVVQEVLKETGLDFSSKILVVSVHTHSAPARFWNLLTNLRFGAMGGGDFHPEVFRRLVHSFAKAIIQANKNLVPGKFGYALKEHFDPTHKVFSDRRSESPPFRLDQLLLMRIEKADGTPLAVLLNFPMHGTISSNTYMTNDAAGGLEFILQEELEKRYKTRIEVMFMQGCAGDISPRGDALGHKSTQQMQMIGHFAAPEILELYKKVQMTDDLDMEMVNKRIAISRKHIGYKDDEFYQNVGGDKVPYRFGAFLCVNKGYSYKTDKTHKDGLLGCLFSVENLNGGPIPQFSKTKLTALRLGDLYIATFPGESTSWLGKSLRDAVLKESQGKIKNFAVMGYAQDHQLYILTEKDWWKGGYEASMSVWGPKFGAYLVKEATALTLQLTTPEKEKNETGILPQDFYNLDMTKTVPREETPDAGKMEKQPPKQYKRMDWALTFSFFGGHIGVDNPHVYLQKKEGTTFKDVMRIGGQRKYDDADYRMRMTFRKIATGRYIYTFYFEELENFPLGTYRFHIVGRQWKDKKIVPYELDTDEFEIIPSDRLKFYDLKLKKDSLEAKVAYPPGTNDDGKTPFVKLQRSHLVHSTLVHPEVAPPLPEGAKVKISIELFKEGKKVASYEVHKLAIRKEAMVKVVTYRAKDGKEKTRAQKALTSGFLLKFPKPLAAGNYAIKMKIVGPYGNTGSFEAKDLKVAP